VASPEVTQCTIGVDATCTDGVCGEVIRIVVDPIARAVTHIVVEPKHRRGQGRLVPLDLVDTTTGEMRLRCTRAEFKKLDHAEETQFLPGASDYEGYGPQQWVSWPYFGLGGTGLGMGAVWGSVTYDTVPLGEVTVRRGEHVHATDGEIGRVQGLVIDQRNHHVTPCASPRGPLVGSQRSGHPHQRRGRNRQRHSAEDHEAGRTGLAFRGGRSSEQVIASAAST